LSVRGAPSPHRPRRPNQRAGNVRNRALIQAAEDASKRLARAVGELLPEGLTLHSLRCTFASLLVALGRDRAVVMRHIGPLTRSASRPAAMGWGDGERERLWALVEAAERQKTGSMAAATVGEAGERPPPRSRNPAGARHSSRAADGTRTDDVLHGKQGVRAARVPK